MCPTTSTLHVENNGVKEEGEEGQREEEGGESREDEGSIPLTMSLQNNDQVVIDTHPSPLTSRSLSDHLPSSLLDHISSPISAQIFDFCDPNIFHDALHNSEVTSSPTGCGYEDQNYSYTTSLSFNPNVANYHNNDNSNSNNKFITEFLDMSNIQGDQYNNHMTTTTNTTTTTSTLTTATTISSSTQHNNGAILFESQDEIDNDISASIDFSPSPSFSTAPYNLNNLTTTTNTTQQQEQQHYHQLILSDHHHVRMTRNDLSQYPTATPGDPTVHPLMAGGLHALLDTVFEDDSLSSIPPFMRINPSVASSSSSCSFLDRSMGSLLPGNVNQGLGSDNSATFSGNLLLPSELQGKELDFHGDNGGIFCPDQLPQAHNSGDMQQAFSNESSQLVSAATSSAPLATEISSLSEDSTFKVGKLSVEQRKEKIHRYLKKRNERNFNKKIKYACRKTLADSRPRVRGRFAKNDDFGDNTRRHINGHHHDEDEYDEVQVKEEDDLVDSSDIFSHISGVNPFKCNYQIKSWI